MKTKELFGKKPVADHHFLDVKDKTKTYLTSLLDLAESFIDTDTQRIKKIAIPQNKMVGLIFFEPSTRTKTTFEIAAKYLGYDTIHLAAETSSTRKGETLLDTVHNLIAMQTDVLVIRHPQSGALECLARSLRQPVPIINAGDGCHAHPSQALIDLYTMRHFKKNLNTLKVAIVGDILHSRVARSNIHALNIMGAQEIRVIGPRTLLPKEISTLGVHVYYDLYEGLKDVDVIMVLRLQQERMTKSYLSTENEYFQFYGLTEAALKVAKEDVIVMHPGPVNQQIEIDSHIADGPHSVILHQVHFGIAVRMALLHQLLSQQISSEFS